MWVGFIANWVHIEVEVVIECYPLNYLGLSVSQLGCSTCVLIFIRG